MFCNIFGVIFQEGAMTALHMLASMKPEEIVLIQFSILVNSGADVDLRAFPPNEAEDRKNLLMDRDIEVISDIELGQTPLHMVCLREDTDPYAVRVKNHSVAISLNCRRIVAIILRPYFLA